MEGLQEGRPLLESSEPVPPPSPHPCLQSRRADPICGKVLETAALTLCGHPAHPRPGPQEQDKEPGRGAVFTRFGILNPWEPFEQGDDNGKKKGLREGARARGTMQSKNCRDRVRNRGRKKGEKSNRKEGREKRWRRRTRAGGGEGAFLEPDANVILPPL